jgi:MHS family proline/betaine transporter-like MFS transporter
MARKKKPSTLKIVTAAIIGHALEFFDFTIYAVFAITIGKQFFPHASEFAQILSSMGAFAAGFLMRPIGGVVFGHIGDKFGRRTSLTISVLLMAILTFLIGILPDYHSIGILAPILLVMIRLVQGLCVGGEGVGASVFVLEHLNKLKPGLVGGIVNSALTFGILLAILTGYFLTSMYGEDSEAWRYAFILGGLFGIVGLYIRLSVDETPEFEEIKRNNKIIQLPIVEVFKHNLNSVILTIAIGAFTSTSNYMIMSYLNVFYKSVMKFDASTALLYSVLGNFLLVVFLVVGGMISDRVR